MPLHPSPAPPADTSRRRLTPASAGYRRSAPADAGLGRLGCKCFETPHWFRRSNKLSHHMPRNISTSGWDVSRLRKTSQSPRAKRGIVGSMRLDVFTTIHRKLKRLIPPDYPRSVGFRSNNTNSFVDQFRLYRLILETEVLLELNPAIRSGSGRSDQVRFAVQL